jgi:hypothetical protein
MAEISVNLPDDLAARLEERAELERSSCDDLATRAVEFYLQHPHAIKADQDGASKQKLS